MTPLIATIVRKSRQTLFSVFCNDDTAENTNLWVDEGTSIVINNRDGVWAGLKFRR